MTDQLPSTESPGNVSGGVNVDAQRDVNIAGDVVGRDKVENIAGDQVAGDKIVEQELTATGTNVIQIGNLNLPLVPLLVALGMGLAVLIFIGFGVSSISQQLRPTPTPGMMSSANFNVVVAGFGEADQNGQVRVTEQSRALSQSVYDTLIAQRDAFPDPIIKSSIALRHGSLPLPDDLVRSEADAEQAVASLNADMLIYGNLKSNGDFTPQFYISPRVRGEVDPLLTGSQTAGLINFAPGSSFGTSTDLRTRASALFFIATGLTYNVFGRAARALEVYRQAEQALVDWPEQGAGKEILYFFKGEAALFQAQQTTGQESADLLNEAEEAFNRAMASDPSYARAHIGLGSANYVRLQRAPALSETLGSPEMQTMLREYATAPELARQSGDRLAEEVGIFSQGLAAFQQGLARRFSDRQAAEASFAQAIDLIRSTQEPFGALKQPRLVAQTQLALGAIYKQQGDILIEQGDRSGGRAAYTQAQKAYQVCVDLAPGSTDRILIDLIAQQRCRPQLDRLNQILAAP
jgi:tetratricopeptide (TPR) repeat protein